MVDKITSAKYDIVEGKFRVNKKKLEKSVLIGFIIYLVFLMIYISYLKDYLTGLYLPIIGVVTMFLIPIFLIFALILIPTKE